jgi:hypothetical protein
MFGGQASNGGLHQFLTNASGDYTTETLMALWLARADISAGLLARALSLFPRGMAPREQGKRIQLLPSTGPACELLDELDAQLYREVFPIESEGRESLDDLLAAFMRQHASEPVIVCQRAEPTAPS